MTHIGLDHWPQRHCSKRGLRGLKRGHGRETSEVSGPQRDESSLVFGGGFFLSARCRTGRGAVQAKAGLPVH